MHGIKEKSLVLIQIRTDTHVTKQELILNIMICVEEYKD